MANYHDFNSDLQTTFGLSPVGSHTSTAAGAIDTNVSLDAPTGASILILQCTAIGIRYKLDRTAATTADGFLLEPTDSEVRLDLFPNARVTVIGTAANAIIQYQWCRPYTNGR